MDEDNKKQEPADKPAKGYGRRPVWQWVAIYLVIAIVVYGLVYILFINGGDDAGTGNLGY
jgi:hypothetical protein